MKSESSNGNCQAKGNRASTTLLPTSLCSSNRNQLPLLQSLEMSATATAPYGHWTSPLTADRLASCSISLHEVAIDVCVSRSNQAILADLNQESTGTIYSIECHPTENGRFAIVQHHNGQSKDILPKELSALATVQEIGGGSIAMRPDGQILFSDQKSCNVYLLDPKAGSVALVRSAAEGIRYADFCTHPMHHQWILAIKEDHRDATPETQATHVHNTLVAINADTGEETTVAQGDDFYSHPKFDPSGQYVSWIQWSHPDMPWTGTVLYVAEWHDASLQNITRVAGKAQEESIAQPKWGLDGALHFASDRSGYWQLSSFNPKTQQQCPLTFKGTENTDFATAEWELGR